MTIAVSNRARVLLVGLLASASALLLLLNLASTKIEDRQTHPLHPDARLAVLQANVDSLLRAHDIDLRAIRTRTVRTGGKEQMRVERSVAVPRDFAFLEFNKDLNLAIRPLNARIIASERPREGKVLMHVLLDGTVVQTIVFIAGS